MNKLLKKAIKLARIDEGDACSRQASLRIQSIYKKLKGVK